MSKYKERTWTSFADLFALAGRQRRVLDFGCGDGWFAQKTREADYCDELVPLDVKRRSKVLVDPVIYTGESLPFQDRQFDLSYAIDVLHHCPRPVYYLDELARVSSRFLLLKDHTYDSVWGRATLQILDELGNRRFGIPSPHNYQRKWGWVEHLLSRGWVERARVHPVRCHEGALGVLTNRLQFASLFERST
ncbi:class I SAM-dependent methyltransferase [Niveibacterium sp. SC-1]|uniref:class I SAM-dependent methyltransferase n=1 Tax=Niveibacterium sp. SC-1 TaxID=3135646 RepID=UPI00311DCF83